MIEIAISYDQATLIKKLFKIRSVGVAGTERIEIAIVKQHSCTIQVVILVLHHILYQVQLLLWQMVIIFTVLVH